MGRKNVRYGNLDHDWFDPAFTCSLDHFRAAEVCGDGRKYPKCHAADDTQPLMERAAARRSVITARSAPEEVSEQEQVIEETVKSIRLTAKRNPLFCADKNYTKCMDAVECYGRMVYTSRLIYNDSVTKLNSELGIFPTNVIAGILGFHKREYLSQDI